MRFLKQWLPVVLWTAVILFASNDRLSADSTGGVLDRLFGFEVPYAVNIAVRKAAHLAVYAILAALTWRADKRRNVVLGIALFVAILDETRQGLMTVSRSGKVSDVVIDMVGAWIAFTVLQRVRGSGSARPS
ncbi:MAG TPA: VanZ family protein [Thermoanaerobaculia bacterium]|nr:VanZ family protein [Thermoanaerobaculia bacterium]